MAEGKAGGAGKKPALSNRIMQMKFMQRSKDKAAVQEAAKEQAVEQEEEEWVANAPAGTSGCVVLTEGNPPPGAHMGHMSFHSFNPDLEKLQEERAALLQNVKKVAAPTADGKAVSDNDMTDRMQTVRSSKADDKVIGSMRSSESRPHEVAKSSSTKSGNKRKRHKPSQ